VVMNRYRVDSLHVPSLEYEKQSEWESMLATSVTEEAMEAPRPGGTGG
jgi:hypothetical protein